MTKLAILFANVGPYHISRLSGVYALTRCQNWEIIPIELARQETEYAWETDRNQLEFTIHSVVTEQPLEQTSFSVLVRRLYQMLGEIKPNVVAIAGYARPAMLAVLLWARLHHTAVILFSETNEHDTKRQFWGEAVKRLLLKQYKSALVGGKPQKRYLEKLGMASPAIFLGYNVVDNETFHPNAIRSLPRPLPTPYFLAVNRFVPKKNLSFLLACYATYRQLAGEHAWHLVLCGDGELRSIIEDQIAELNLQNVIHLPGFLQQNELLPYFAHANCFIHASIQEQWGLVVNEAMAARLPVLISKRCGCFEDLVIEGVNGFGFDPKYQQHLTHLMAKMSSGETNLDAMGQAGLDHIQKFSPDYFAQGLIQAVQYALEHRK
jgi:1,2-diacylglycerol 3-alpha-glucosyltransferase